MFRKSRRVRGVAGGIESREMIRTSMSEEDREAYVQMLLRGASPAGACQQLKLDLFVVLEAIAEDEPFRELVEKVTDVLSQNVAARLYQEAMKGNVSAMTQWLKSRPPPEWQCGEREELKLGWDGMSDEELLEWARAEEIAIPVELAGGIAEANGEERAEEISGFADA